jgi:hypothetical protein
MKEEKKGIEVWDPLEIEKRRCVIWRFPPKHLFVERIEHELHVLSRPVSGGETTATLCSIEKSEKPESNEWRHYLTDSASLFQPVPVLPDRPLVIRPDRSLTILPGESSQFFLQIPVWFRLTSAMERPVRIFEEPLSILSNTWFGDPVTGELCYSLAIRLHQGIESVVPSQDRAICPLFLTNDSSTDLVFEKICIHVENLSVFMSAVRMWTNRLNVIFKGSDQSTQIQIVNAAPDFEGGVSLVSGARMPTEGWNIKKTFSMLKYFAEF